MRFKTEHFKRKRYVPLAPEFKAKKALGFNRQSRLTIAQYELLVRLGCDGDVAKDWSNYRAHQEITKRLARKSPELKRM